MIFRMPLGPRLGRALGGQRRDEPRTPGTHRNCATSISALGVAVLLNAGVSVQAPASEPENLHRVAFRAAAEEKARAYGHLKGEFYSLVVERDFTTDEFPAEVGPFHVTLLDHAELCARSAHDQCHRLHLQLRKEAVEVRPWWRSDGDVRLDPVQRHFVVESVALGGV